MLIFWCKKRRFPRFDRRLASMITGPDPACDYISFASLFATLPSPDYDSCCLCPSFVNKLTTTTAIIIHSYFLPINPQWIIVGFKASSRARVICRRLCSIQSPRAFLIFILECRLVHRCRVSKCKDTILAKLSEKIKVAGAC